MDLLPYHQLLIKFLKETCITGFTLSLKKKRTYLLFGFRQKYSTTNALIYQ